MSDHHMVCFTLKLPKPRQMQTVSTLRNYRKIDNNQFSNSLSDLISQPLPESVDELFEWYDSGMVKLLNKFAPANTKTYLVKNRVPWYNDSIHVARQERRQVERKWRKSRYDHNHELFLKAKKAVRDLTETAKRDYFKDKLSSCSDKAVADLRGGGGFRGFKPPLGLPSKNLMCIEKRHHYVQTHTVCSYSTLSQAQPQAIGFNPPPPPLGCQVNM